jgi:aminopeptidase N
MWVHEGFTNYSEGIYTECQQGKEAGAKYIIGSRRNITNRSPIIAPYGVNGDGSGDMYYKGGSMLHMMRQIVNDDEKWRVGVLRGLNKEFWHQTVTSAQVEAYINKVTGINFDKVFDQYLRTTRIPTIEYKLTGNVLSYHWANTVAGFDMPVRVSFDGGTTWSLVKPTEAYQNAPVRVTDPAAFKIDENWYVMSKNITGN